MWNDGAVIVVGRIRQAPTDSPDGAIWCSRINNRFRTHRIARHYGQEDKLKTRWAVTASIALLAISSPALAKDQSLGEAQQSGPPERISFLVTFGTEKCPDAVGDEIMVCAVQPEGDRFRIPKPIRPNSESPVAGGSWTSAVESLDGYARAVLPNSCSVNGSNGFTGCMQQALQKMACRAPRNTQRAVISQASELFAAEQVIHRQSPKLPSHVPRVEYRLTCWNK